MNLRVVEVVQSDEDKVMPFLMQLMAMKWHMDELAVTNRQVGEQFRKCNIDFKD